MIVEDYTIRTAQSHDVELLPGIEREAASLFASRASELGLRADGPPEVNSVVTLRRAQEAGQLWVAVDSTDRAVGFALVHEIDGCAHLEEMDVLPAHGRKGIGSALLEAVCSWANAIGFSAVTLSTFREVPWNGPFYRQRGFCVVEPSALSAGLRRLVQIERANGLRTDLRVIMKREISK